GRRTGAAHDEGGAGPLPVRGGAGGCVGGRSPAALVLRNDRQPDPGHADGARVGGGEAGPAAGGDGRLCASPGRLPQLPGAVRAAGRPRAGPASAHRAGEQPAVSARAAPGGVPVTAIPLPPRGVALRPLALPAEHGGWGFVLEPIVLGLL